MCHNALMAMQITQEERDRERALFEAERARVPESFVRAPMVDDDAVLRSVGIEGLPQGRPVAYLKLMPQDFVVEEIDREGNIHEARREDAAEEGPAPEGEGATYYADLVKVGISTLEAKAELAHALGTEEKNIGFAGVKDRMALTSQAISMRGVADPGAFSRLDRENLFLNGVRRGKGAVANGDLKGNEFTIALRFAEPPGRATKDFLDEQIAIAKEEGFWNFFYLQRFGTPRLIAHILGRLLVQGKYEDVVKTFLTHRAERELPYFAALRVDIENKWGDWKGIREIVDRFPYHFGIERSFVAHLMEKPGDFLGALHEVPDQVRMWFYAYDSLLFNKKLSALIKSGEVPLDLPFLTSFNPVDWKPYAEFLEEDGVVLPTRSWKDFPFVRVESRRCATLQNIEMGKTSFEGRVGAISFSLPKGSYATSFLMNLFSLASGLPVVPGISTEGVDVKAMLGTGSLAPVLERFKTVLDRRQADIEAGEGAE